MKKFFTRGISVLVILAVIAMICVGRKQRAEQTAYTKNIFAMNTVFLLKAYGPNAEQALNAAQARTQELERAFSVTMEGSDLWEINHTRRAVVCPDTLAVIKTAKELGDETDGALDITIYPVLREWGFTVGEYKIPEAEKRKTLLEKVDYRQVATDETSREVCVPEGVELDFGSLAKGYAGDCLVDILRKEGVTSAILELGGNVQTLGTKPDGTLWKVAIKDPFDAEKELGFVQTADKAVVTSGSYERFFVGEDGKKYWHILNPADGCPADNGLVSVTVVGDSGVRCDGLSTALFVMGRERAVSYWQGKQDFEMILAADGGELWITEGLTGYFQEIGEWKTEIITAE